MVINPLNVNDLEYFVELEKERKMVKEIDVSSYVDADFLKWLLNEYDMTNNPTIPLDELIVFYSEKRLVSMKWYLGTLLLKYLSYQGVLPSELYKIDKVTLGDIVLWKKKE